MADPLAFTKMHGAGNDFLLIDARGRDDDWSQRGRELCDRHFGVGGDGLLLLTAAATEASGWGLRIINSDGSQAQMCGNGIRCFAKWLHDAGLETRDEFEVDTAAGLMRPKLVDYRGGPTAQVAVDMGRPGLSAAQVPFVADERYERLVDVPLEAGGERFRLTPISMGNPHAVVFVPSIEEVAVEAWGRAIQTHPSFPEQANVEFVQVEGPNELTMRVWERGAGRTLACGTGACASLVAGVISGRCGRQATVHLDGGDLEIEWREDDHLLMTGPATTVFTGRVG